MSFRLATRIMKKAVLARIVIAVVFGIGLVIGLVWAKDMVPSASPNVHTAQSPRTTPSPTTSSSEGLTLPSHRVLTPTSVPTVLPTPEPTIPPTPMPTMPPADNPPVQMTPPPADNPPPTSSGGMTDHELAVAQQLLQLINQDRAAHGLPGYTWNDGLVRAAYKHNLQMENCGMSHQCPGEPGLGTRISNEGVDWSAVGENVGWSSRNDTWAAVKGLHESMMAETPPEDGHRKSLLSSTYTQVGIAIYIDKSGRVWLTEDFKD